MNTLEDAWNWYQDAKRQVGLVLRLASAQWLELPWEGPLGRDDRFKGLERKKLEEDTQATLAQMDDVAVLVLLSPNVTSPRGRPTPGATGRARPPRPDGTGPVGKSVSRLPTAPWRPGLAYGSVVRPFPAGDRPASDRPDQR